MNARIRLMLVATIVALIGFSTPFTNAQDTTPSVRFFTRRFDFGKHKAENGHNVVTDNITIKRNDPSAKAKVVLALCGFDVRFSDSDHQFTRLAINIEPNGPGPYVDSVPVKVSLLLSDKNGDDDFEGNVTVGVIVVDSTAVHAYADTKTFQQNSGAGPMKDNAYLAANVPNVDRVALIRGFDIAYGDSDHHVLAIDGAVQATTLPHQGAEFDAVTCELGLRDSSGDWDDLYGGSISFSMLRFPKGSLHLDRGESTVDGKGDPKSATGTHSIETTVQSQDVFTALSGFHLAFSGSDHHVTRFVSAVDVDAVAPAAEKTQSRFGTRVESRTKMTTTHGDAGGSMSCSHPNDAGELPLAH